MGGDQKTYDLYSFLLKYTYEIHSRHTKHAYDPYNQLTCDVHMYTVALQKLNLWLMQFPYSYS